MEETAVSLISQGAFELLVYLAVALTSVAPLLLAGLLVRDWRNRRMW